jgi:hypothetical protein
MVGHSLFNNFLELLKTSLKPDDPRPIETNQCNTRIDEIICYVNKTI